MIKYFHELTEAEFGELIKQKMTWGECAEKYPQPEWCSYPDAVDPLGCWSLIGHEVTGRRYCMHCDCYIPKKKKVGVKDVAAVTE